MAILPADHAARLLEYYIRSLVERSGLRWTEANTADFDLLGELLAQVETPRELDSIPPFERPIVSDRQTVVLEREPGNGGIPDQDFQKWRGRRGWNEDEDVRRLVRR